MAVRWFFYVIFVLVGVSFAWGKRHWIAEFVSPPPPPKPIVFDNGSVRDSAPAPAPAAEVTKFPPGTLRKCVRGQQVSYSNISCPPGHKESAVGGTQLTVLPAPPGAPATRAAASGNGQSRLHEALDLTRDERLRERMIEKAIDGAR